MDFSPLVVYFAKSNWFRGWNQGFFIRAYPTFLLLFVIHGNAMFINVLC